MQKLSREDYAACFFDAHYTALEITNSSRDAFEFSHIRDVIFAHKLTELSQELAEKGLSPRGLPQLLNG